MNKLNNLVISYEDAKRDAEIAEQLNKDAKSRKHQAALDLCDYMRENMIENVTVDGKTVKARYSQKYTVRGGKKQTDERTAFLAIIEELGYGEHIKTYKDVDERRLKRIIAEMPPEFLQNLLKQKLVSAYDFPDVEIK